MKLLHSCLMLFGVLTISMAVRGAAPATITERSVYQLDSHWTRDAGRDIQTARLTRAAAFLPERLRPYVDILQPEQHSRRTRWQHSCRARTRAHALPGS